MTMFKDRTGDFTKKKYLYKFYKNGYTSQRPKYMTAGQYMGGVGELISGTTAGSASIGGSVSGGGLSIYGSGDSNVGLFAGYKVSTDPRRKIDLEKLTMQFQHSSGTFNTGSLTYYEMQIFDYRILVTTSGNTIKAFYKTTELASATMSSSYSYIRLRESEGVVYIERSSDGNTWTAWTSRTIDFDNDTTRSVVSLSAAGGAGGLGGFSVNMYGIEATSQDGQLLAIESVTLDDLSYNAAINNPASSTTIRFPYDPLNVPSHFDLGNFVEIYASFFDDGAIRSEPILDHNNEPILDHNNEPIYGVVVSDNIPEELSILKFSGFISAIDYNYDEGNIEVTFVSHGEIAANSAVRAGESDVSIIEQTAYTTVVATTSQRQTFTLSKMTKIDAVTLRVAYGAGGSSSVEIGSGSTVLATSHIHTWSGTLGESNLLYRLNAPLYLEAGQYWIRETGGINWRYQNTDVLTDGSRQTLSGGVWSDVTGDAYFILWSSQPQLNISISGTVPEVAQSIYDQSLMLDYSPVYIETVEDPNYSIDIALNIDHAKNALNALYRQLPTGWYYRIDVGTGALTIKNKNSTPDHLLVYGRDFTKMILTKDITEIVNEIYFVGGEISTGNKLTSHFESTDSIAEYRQGLTIATNDKVTRYDTAELLSNHTISNNSTPRITTEITISSAKYNIETIHEGDVVKIVNGDTDVLASTLVIASIAYSPTEVTLSLESAPLNLSSSIDKIQRDLENQSTAAAGSVV